MCDESNLTEVKFNVQTPNIQWQRRESSLGSPRQTATFRWISSWSPSPTPDRLQWRHLFPLGADEPPRDDGRRDEGGSERRPNPLRSSDDDDDDDDDDGKSGGNGRCSREGGPRSAGLWGTVALIAWSTRTLLETPFYLIW